MTTADSTPAAAVLVAIDIAKPLPRCAMKF